MSEALKPGVSILKDRHWGLMRFDRYDDSARRAFLTGLFGGPVRLLVPADMKLIGEDLGDGWIAAPEGGWNENPFEKRTCLAFRERQSGYEGVEYAGHVEWSAVSAVRLTGPEATQPEGKPTAEEAAADRAKRDLLNSLLSTNPAAAKALHDLSKPDEPFDNHAGQLPFEVVVWIATVAEQLGIQPLDNIEPGSAT